MENIDNISEQTIDEEEYNTQAAIEYEHPPEDIQDTEDIENTEGTEDTEDTEREEESK